MSSVNCGSSAFVCDDRQMEVLIFSAVFALVKHLINDIYAFLLIPRDFSSSSTLKTLNYMFQMHSDTALGGQMAQQKQQPQRRAAFVGAFSIFTRDIYFCN